MKSDYLRLECRIKRWNADEPCVFLIDTTHKTLPTAVYNKKTLESMDNIKGKRPRPLKTHAYNYGRVLDVRGDPITGARATDSVSADAFVKSILEAAEPVSREEFLAERDRIIWPSSEEREHPDKRPYLKPAEEDLSAAPLKTLGLDFIAARSGLPVEPRSHNLFLHNQHQERPPSNRKSLIRQLTELLPRMDEDDLEALLKLARTLAEE